MKQGDLNEVYDKISAAIDALENLSGEIYEAGSSINHGAKFAARDQEVTLKGIDPGVQMIRGSIDLFKRQAMELRHSGKLVQENISAVMNFWDRD